MRRRITLLVAATTSLVLLAFLLPSAYLVARVAHNSAVSQAQIQVQALIPVLALSPVSATDVAVRSVRDAGYLVWVTVSGATVIGVDPSRGALDSYGLAHSETVEVASAGGAQGGVLIALPVARSDGSAVIRLLVPDSELSKGVTRIWLLLAGIGLVLFLSSLLVADRIARSMTRPITELAGAARRLGDGDLTARVTPSGPREVVGVGVALNHLGSRIDELLTAERESVADLSHRLRTPLTALRLDVESVGDVAQRDRLAADLTALDREVDQIIRSARRANNAAAGQREPGRCDAVAVVRDRMVFWKVLAAHQARELITAIADTTLPVGVTSGDLAAALDALVGNVFAHTPVGTAFEVRCAAGPSGGATVTIIDCGAGWADDEVGPRGESGGGSTGLGLDIARQLATGTGGTLHIGRTPDGRTEVRLDLGPAVVAPLADTRRT